MRICIVGSMRSSFYDHNGIGCSRPNVPYSVLIEGASLSSYHHGDRLTYSCKPGFAFERQGTEKIRDVQCDTGIWNPSFDTCSGDYNMLLPLTSHAGLSLVTVYIFIHSFS